MKFVYGYKTKDNETKEGLLSASSRDEAYRVLKTKGIRPFSVKRAPGIWNGILSIGWGGLSFLVLAVLAALSISYAMMLRMEAARGRELSICEPRAQIYGDPVFLADCKKMNWTNVFENAGECLLASFAEPGRKIEGRLPEEAAQLLIESLAHNVAIDTSEDAPVVKMKRIVNWMKRELRQYLADGGTIDGYLQRLRERQIYEEKFRKRAETELEIALKSGRKDIHEIWMEKNEGLRALGLRLIPLPEPLKKIENYPVDAR